MSTPRIPANGVPWLYWIGGTSWKCQGCGEAGRQPQFNNAGDLARWLTQIKTEHATCGTFDEAEIEAETESETHEAPDNVPTGR